MEISNCLNIYKNNPTHIVSTLKERNETSGYSSMPNCCPAYFSPSFTAMKKKEFKGTDSLVVEKFKAPIQSFKTKDDFDVWAEKECQKLLKKNYTGRKEDTAEKRKEVLNEWKTYIYEENKEYTPAERLLIFDGITKGLGKKDESLPPLLNKGVLAQTIYNLKNEAQNDPNKKDYNFNKTYQNNLRVFEMGGDVSTGTEITGWVRIPSKENDPENFEENVKKLQNLSHPSWCTKTYNAEPYLKDGDFHVYLEKGKPRLGVRFVGNKIEEIQGPKNNGKIPFSYYDTCKSYIDENKFMLKYTAKDELEQARIIKEKYTPFIKEIREASPEERFKKLNINARKDNDNLYILENFACPRTDEMVEDRITFDDLGITMDELLEKVKEIEGCADFKDCTINEFKHLKRIGGTVTIFNATVNSLGSLKEIGENVYISYSTVNSLGAIEGINGQLYIDKTELKPFENLKRINGDADLRGANIESLGSLEEIGGSLYLHTNKTLKTLGNLKKIGKDAYFRYSNIESLGELEEIGGNAHFGYTPNLKSLNKLNKIGGNIYYAIPSGDKKIASFDILKEKIKND